MLAPDMSRDMVFRSGCAAFKQGDRIQSNPYDPLRHVAFYAAWGKGYLAAEQQGRSDAAG